MKYPNLILLFLFISIQSYCQNSEEGIILNHLWRINEICIDKSCKLKPLGKTYYYPCKNEDSNNVGLYDFHRIVITDFDTSTIIGRNGCSPSINIIGKKSNSVFEVKYLDRHMGDLIGELIINDSQLSFVLKDEQKRNVRLRFECVEVPPYYLNYLERIYCSNRKLDYRKLFEE